MRRRSLPPVPELLAHLAEHGVDEAPREGPDDTALQGLLAFALHLADRDKQVSFPGFTWDDPRFVAQDRKVRVTLAYATLPSRDALEATLRATLPRLAPPPALVALDARPSGLAEFELGHRLYGEVTLFAWPHKPAESADPRLHAAAEKGWTRTLKEHNLLPGRGIVVLDENQGLLLREPGFDALPGVLLLTESGEMPLWWNPVAKDLDPELQYWLQWGGGDAASRWREVLHVTKDDVEP